MASNLSSAGLLALSAAQTNWLTPVWLYTLGIFGRRIPGLNQIHDNLTSRIIFGLGLAVVYLGIFLVISFLFAGDEDFKEHFGVLVTVLTPISLIIGFGAWALISKRQIGETSSVFGEGFLRWLNWFCISAVVFAVGGYFLSQANGFGIINPVESPDALIESLARLPFAGTTEGSFVIPPTTEGNPHPIAIEFDGAELKTVDYEANKKVLLMVEETHQGGLGTNLFPEGPVNQLYVANLSDSDAKLNLTFQTGPIYSEVVIVPVLALGILAIYVLYLCLSTLFAKTFAVAHSTFKTEISQPGPVSRLPLKLKVARH